MRKFILATGFLLLPAAPAFAQTAPAGAAPGGEPLLVKSIEPDLSTDARSLDDVRHKMQKQANEETARRKKDQPRPAQAAEILSGKEVRDTSGQVIALVDKVEGSEAVLRSGTSVVRVPFEAFGMNKKGLLLNLTKPQFDQMVVSLAATTQRSQ